MQTLENAIIRLLRNKPFYGHFLLNLRRAESVSSHAAGVTVQDGVPTLCINPEILEKHSPDERSAILEHLVKHIIHLHPLRRKGRNPHDWDICCDLAVNPGIRNLPEDSLLPEMYGCDEGLAAEEYYDKLVPKFDTGNLQGSGYGDNDTDEHGASVPETADISTADTLDDHEIWNDADSTPLPLAEEMIRAITSDALRGSDGEPPGDLRNVVEKLLRPPGIPWRQVLRQFVATAGRIGRKNTWIREHRRFAHATPGVRKRRRLNLLVGIDVSDSTDILELREAFAHELMQIARGRDSRITVLYAGSRIQKIDSFNSSACAVECYEGGGFTDLRPVFDYAHAMCPLPAAVIYLTDGIGSAPENMEFPTLWVLTAEGKKPVHWGVELRLKI